MFLLQLFSVLHVDSVDGSTVLILNLSVAASDSHEGMPAVLLAFLGRGDVLLQFLEELNGLVVAEGNLVRDLLFFDASHARKAIEGALSDRNNAFDDVPEDALVTWSCGQRALIGPSLIEVDLVHELFQIQFKAGGVFLVFNKLEHELVVPLNLGLRIFDVHFFEVLLRHDFEKEAEHTSSELRVIVFPFTVQEMDDVHFEIEELTVNGMFTWGMEMELCAMESGDRDVWVEEGDGLSFEAVEILALGLTLGNIEEVSVSNFIELELFLFLSDLVIMEAELFIFEILEDCHFGAQVDWSLFLAEIAWLSSIHGFFHLQINLGIEIKIDTGPLTDVMLVILGKVILEFMHMVGLAAWTAFGLGPLLLRVILTDELPVLLVVLVGILLEIDVLDGKLARLLDLLVRPLDFTSFESRLTFG